MLVYVRECVCVCACDSIYVHICVYICLVIYSYPCVNVCMHMYIYIYIYIYIYVYTCICFLCTHIYIYICVDLGISVYLNACRALQLNVSHFVSSKLRTEHISSLHGSGACVLYSHSKPCLESSLYQITSFSCASELSIENTLHQDIMTRTAGVKC